MRRTHAAVICLTSTVRIIAMTALVGIGGPPMAAEPRDEAEVCAWAFATSADGWSGLPQGKPGPWPARDGTLRATAVAGKPLLIEKHDLRIDAGRATVLQIRVDASRATKGRLWYTTGVSPIISRDKMIEFAMRPDEGPVEYSFDLAQLSSWKDEILTLRFEFLGVKPDDAAQVTRIRLLHGDTISTPLAYTAFAAGMQPKPRPFRLASLFHENMVLQRDQPIPVWGRAPAGEVIVVRFGKTPVTATADAQGRWLATLPAEPASAEPRSLIAAGETSGETITLHNVVVGDVWLAGGQSNMGSSPFDNPPPDARRVELLETEYPAFRVVSIPTLNRETPLANDACEDSFAWRVVEPKSLRGLSAVGNYFGQAVHTSQRIPVGLIFVIKAGSQVEQWLDRDTLHSLFSDEQVRAICGGSHLESGLHNGMIAPLPPFPIRGAVWYQGESNTVPRARCDAYAHTLPALVRSWRRIWGNELPVCIVQLPAFEAKEPESWPRVREVQLIASEHIPGVALAVTFDEGDPKNLHPFNKYMVGTRLALAARAEAYGEKVVASGPRFAGLERRDGTLVLRFDDVAEGLVARKELAGFEVRADDGRWLPARAAISGADRVVLSCPQVSEPQAARYAWANVPQATLFNSAGLPASPFRSDVPTEVIDAVTGRRLADEPYVPGRTSEQ